MFRLMLLLITITILFLGCEYFDDSEDALNPIIDSTPVVIPVNAEWDFIAILERNPLRPTQFYIFPEEMLVINSTYVAGKHFIFEIGLDPIETNTNRIRHYIIQPEPPFQDKHKSAGQLSADKQFGVEFQNHYYSFLSEGWYTGAEAIGLGVEFGLTHFKPTEQFPDPAETLHSTKIGIIDQFYTPIVGTAGRSFIKENTRLRVYVSK